MKNERVSIEFDERILIPANGTIVCPVHVLPLNEFKVKEFCIQNGITYYLPLIKVFKLHAYQSHGKSYKYSRVVLRPMFPSYIFVRISKEQQLQLWSSRSVMRFLDSVSQESLLEDIRTIHAIETVGMEQEIEFNVGLKEGDHFSIESGIWEGVSGWLKTKDKKSLWTVELEFLDQLVRTEINPSEYKMKRID